MNVSGRSNERAESNEQNSPVAVEIMRNGLIGGVVAVFLSFVPFSTVIGGGIAGYLQHRRGSGIGMSGAVAGAIGFLPYVVVGGFLIHSPSYVPPGTDIGLAPHVLIAGVIAFGAIYAIGLGTLGGVLGGYVRLKARG